MAGFRAWQKADSAEQSVGGRRRYRETADRVAGQGAAPDPLGTGLLYNAAHTKHQDQAEDPLKQYNCHYGITLQNPRTAGLRQV